MSTQKHVIYGVDVDLSEEEVDQEIVDGLREDWKDFWGENWKSFEPGDKNGKKPDMPDL